MSRPVSRRSLVASTSAALAIAAAGRWVAPVWAQTARPRPTLVRLIANENPYGPSASARAAAAESLATSWQYAVRREAELLAMIAEREGVSGKHIMISAGSSEVLRVAALAWARDGGNVIAARPTFSFLPDYARQLGAGVVEVDLDESMHHDLEAMAARVDERTRLVYVCNPNNPTGTRLPVDRLRDFVADVSPAAPVVVDEAYLDLDPDWAKHSVVPRVLAGDNVIVTRTFSKLHGMAGMRIGYAIAPPALIDTLKQLRVSLLNLPGLQAATSSYRDVAFQDFSRARIGEAMNVTTATLDQLKLAYTPSFGNFILFDTGGSVAAFSKAMRAEGFMVGRSYAPYQSWVRVSLGTVEQMDAFAGAARRYFGG